LGRWCAERRFPPARSKSAAPHAALVVAPDCVSAGGGRRPVIAERGAGILNPGRLTFYVGHMIRVVFDSGRHGRGVIRLNPACQTDERSGVGFARLRPTTEPLVPSRNQPTRMRPPSND
jgi:hypothetical protein